MGFEPTSLWPEVSATLQQTILSGWLSQASVIILGVIMLNAMNVIMLSVIMLSVIMRSVVLLIVIYAKSHYEECCFANCHLY